MSDSNATRPSLLVRIQNSQDVDAWAQFVRVYSPLVYRYARRRGMQDADAADLTQDVLRTVAHSIKRFHYDRRQGSFRGWFMAVVRTRLCNLVESRGRGVLGSGDTAILKAMESQESKSNEDDQWEQEYRKCLFDWAVSEIRGGFQENTWQAFWKTSIDGEDTRSVAKSLGIPVASVYLARSRVLAKLRKKIRQVDEYSEP